MILFFKIFVSFYLSIIGRIYIVSKKEGYQASYFVQLFVNSFREIQVLAVLRPIGNPPFCCIFWLFPKRLRTGAPYSKRVHLLLLV